MIIGSSVQQGVSRISKQTFGVWRANLLYWKFYLVNDWIRWFSNQTFATNTTERGHSWEPDGHSSTKEIPAFYRPRRAITVFTRASLCTLLSHMNPTHIHKSYFSSSSKVCPLYSGFPSLKTKFRHLSLSLVSSSVSPWFVMLRLTPSGSLWFPF
jgi:hypothetical protein